MLKKFLEEVVVNIVGKQAEGLVDIIHAKKHVNEFLIAKKLDITVNQVRNMLYKLSDHGIVSYIRKKDKRKGWYTYFWKIEPLKALELLKEIIEKRIDQMNYQIESREKKLFYVCKRCSIEFNEENALLYNFTCSECGSVFEVKDNSKLLKELKKNLSKDNEELSFVDEEAKKEKEKKEKIKIKEAKKEERLKKKKRAKKKAEKKTPKTKKPKKKAEKKPKKVKAVKKIKKFTKKQPKKKAKKKVTKKKIKKK